MKFDKVTPVLILCMWSGKANEYNVWDSLQEKTSPSMFMNLYDLEFATEQ